MPLPLLVSNLINIRYLTGVEMTFGMVIMHDRVGARHASTRLSTGAVPLQLFVDNRYTEKAKKGARRGIRVLPIDDLPKHLKKIKRLRFEADDVTVARLNRWKKRYKGVRWIPSEGVIEEMRRVKKKEEIRAIRKACRITDQVLKLIPKMLGSRRGPSTSSGQAPRCAPTGLTEKKLAWHIEKLSRDLGADAMAFDTIVGFGNHTARPHHSPTNRKLKRQDIIQIDMGVKVDGYCSDCSRVFFIGKPTKEQKEVFDLLVRTAKETTKKVKAEVTNRALDRFARKLLGNYAQHFTHGLGHGVGLEIHEGISLSSKSVGARHVVPLQENEVVTIEPGIYFPGKFGMRVENTILVGKQGAFALTKAPW